MTAELKKLRIDRSAKPAEHARPLDSRTRWAIAASIGLAVFVMAGFLVSRWNTPPEVRVMSVRAVGPSSAEGALVLNATGYIVPAHKIEVAAKVVGKVEWIGVEKGDRVSQGQVLVRLEDDEYRARVLEAQGQIDYLRTRLAELVNGSRPQEIAKASADLNQAGANLENAKVSLQRTRALARDGILARQALDDAQSKYDEQAARFTSLEKSLELVRVGPRQEEIDGMRAQIEQAEGTLAYARTQLANTVIRAPVTGTILERNVEKAEFVTTGFVGDKGAKGYVVSLADLNDLQVELDISQNDFARLRPDLKATITTDAYRDRQYGGQIDEISPEANRQKATVQVKVQIQNPDAYLRPEMNASVRFSEPAQAGSGVSYRPLVRIPASALHDGSVFIVRNGKATRREVQAGTTSAEGVEIISGLIGGEALIVEAPAGLKDGQQVKIK
jgi:HlyD family secretion protein